MADSFRRYGDLRKVEIGPLSIEEWSQVCQFTNRKRKAGYSSFVTISKAEFLSGFKGKNNVFAGYDALEVVLAFAGGRPETDAECEARLENERLEWFRRLFAGCSSEWGQTVLGGIEAKVPALMLFNRMWREKGSMLAKDASPVVVALARMPLLPPVSQSEFANVCSGDPHAFDRRRISGRLLRAALRYLLGPGEGVPIERENAGLISAGIEPSELNSNVTVYNFVVDGRPQTGAFPASYWLSLSGVEIDTKVVVAMEGSGAYERMRRLHLPEGTAVACLSGQHKYGTIKFLELCKEKRIRLLYSGDLDPEGLVIAQKCVTRAPGLFKPVGYDRELYWRFAGKRKEKKISNRRLAQLSRLTHPALVTIGEVMLKAKTPVYQEDLLVEIEKAILTALEDMA
nr:TIGR02679 domain-containing protein [Sporomusa sphaeroides]